MKSFKVAIQLLTQIPIKVEGNIEREDYGKALLFYPLVGFLLALILLPFALGAQIFPASLMAVLILVLWVLLTGCLHLDGLADCADAWLGGYGDKEKTLRILKEPASGPAAICSIVLVLIVKFVALHQLLQHSYFQVVIALVLVLVLARLCVVYLFVTSPYVKKMGLGFTISENVQKTVARNLVFGIVVGSILIGFLTGLFAVLAASLVFWMIDKLSRERLGGFTGEVAGAMIEIAEAVILFFCTLSFFVPISF